MYVCINCTAVAHIAIRDVASYVHTKYDFSIENMKTDKTTQSSIFFNIIRFTQIIIKVKYACKFIAMYVYIYNFFM